MLSTQYLFLAHTVPCVALGEIYPDMITVMFGESIMSHRESVILLVSLGIMMPLAMMRDITRLAVWSLLAIVAIVFVGIVLIINGSQIEHPPDRYKNVVSPGCTGCISRWYHLEVG